MLKRTDTKPWYKQPLVWMLISFPLSAVIGGIITIYIAVVTSDGLVKDDYYKEGKQINRLLEREETASKLGLYGQLNINKLTNTVQLKLSNSTNTPLPDTLELALLHSTRAGLDQTITLQKAASDNYHGLINAMPDGRWYIQLSTKKWRLLSEMRLPNDSQVQLGQASKK